MLMLHVLYTAGYGHSHRMNPLWLPPASFNDYVNVKVLAHGKRINLGLGFG